PTVVPREPNQVVKVLFPLTELSIPLPPDVAPKDDAPPPDGRRTCPLIALSEETAGSPEAQDEIHDKLLEASRYGIAYGRASRHERGPDPEVAARDAEIHTLRQQGKKLAWLSKHFGLSQSAIRKACKRHQAREKANRRTN